MSRKLFDGSTPGPGRPKGSVSGRTRALQILDEILEEAENQEAMREALTGMLRRDPVRFFRDIVMPLLPRHAVLAAGGMADQAVKWVSLTESCAAPPPETSLVGQAES
jgi:hypothetical protein